MPLNTQHVGDLIRTGESETVEFKRVSPTEDDIARILVAFANTEGGTLIIGVDDQSSVVGVPENQVGRTVAALRRICSSLFRWPNPVESVIIEDRNVVYAHVRKAPTEYKPVTTSRGKIFVREGERVVERPVRELTPKFQPDSIQSAVVLFVAMSFREEEEPALVDYWNAMQRAVAASRVSIELRRIDLVEGDYEISQKVMEEIDRADIILADFTLNPRNVYFELGYARAAKRQVIQTARKETILEFDIRNWRTLFYRNATELESKLIPAIEAAYTEVISKQNR